MARILKRPMFNRGGSTNNGIMTGLVDRKGYAEGPTQAEIYAKEYEDMSYFQVVYFIKNDRNIELNKLNEKDSVEILKNINKKEDRNA